MFHTPEDRLRAKMRIKKAKTEAARKVKEDREALKELKKRSRNKVKQMSFPVTQKKHKVKTK
jgi:hypothetical protein